MAITTTFKQIKEKFIPEYWASIEEFEEYHLLYISETSQDTNYYTDKMGVERIISPIDHHPELKEYEVWMEGFAISGQHSGAQLQGRVKARSFAQACHIVMCIQLLRQVDEENSPDNKEYSTPGRWDYNPSGLTYWGCSLYWSEELARKSFG